MISATGLVRTDAQQDIDQPTAPIAQQHIDQPTTVSDNFTFNAHSIDNIKLVPLEFISQIIWTILTRIMLDFLNVLYHNTDACLRQEETLHFV